MSCSTLAGVRTFGRAGRRHCRIQGQPHPEGSGLHPGHDAQAVQGLLRRLEDEGGSGQGSLPQAPPPPHGRAH